MSIRRGIRSVAVVCAVACMSAAAVFSSSCTVSDSAECSADEDCGDEQRCVSAGGLFVRDGVCVDEDPGSEPEPPPDDCARFEPISAAVGQPAAVSALFEVRDCDTGEPLPQFGLHDFEVLEDDEPVDDELLRDWTEQGHRHYATLLIDLSGAAWEERHAIIGAAGDFATELLDARDADDTYVGIELFDGSDTITRWQPPLDDPQRLESRIDAILGDFDAENTDETNLYGAIVDGLDGLRDHLEAVETIHDDGVRATGHLAVFSANDDTVGAHEIEEVRQAVDQAESGESGEHPDVAAHVSVMAMETGQFDGGQLADSLGEQIPVVITDPDRLGEAFADLAGQLADRIESTHLLTYCSAGRSDEHTLRVGLEHEDVASEPLELQFDAGDFGDGCDAEFLGGACDNFDCGGLLCGGCDDEAQVCDDGRCLDYCRAGEQCLDGIVENQLGYEQSCELEEQFATCDAQCVDTASDPAHCGSCGNHCPEGIGCDDGVCACGDGDIGCFGECVDPTSDDAHCGGCDVGCEVRCRDESCIGAEWVSAGDRFSCAILEDGTLECWGRNDSGQLGAGEQSDSEHQPRRVEQLDDVVGVYPGWDHGCAVTSDGTLWCWGDNTYGQLGDGTTDHSSSPVVVDDDQFDGEIAAVEVGEEHSCASTDAGELYCWGRNNHGQLGVGSDVEESSEPLVIENLADFEVVDLAVGEDHTCALGSVDIAVNGGGADKTIYCWGRNINGQTGYDETEDVYEPHQVGLIGELEALAGGDRHNCATDSEGSVFCWGRPNEGQLGLEDPDSAFQPEPVPIEGLEQVQTLMARGYWNCAVDAGSEVYCWGSDAELQQGGITGDDGSTAEPLHQEELGDFEQFAMGGRHVCGVDHEGLVQCRGRNTDDQLGIDSDVAEESSFMTVVWH